MSIAPAHPASPSPGVSPVARPVAERSAAALAHLEAARAERRLLVVVDRLALGGVAALYGSVARAAAERGWAVVIAGAAAQGTERVDWGGAHLLCLPDWRPAILPALDALARAATLTAWAVAPETTPLTPLLAASGRAVMTIHGPPAVMREWLQADRLAVLGAAMGAHPHLGALVPGPPYVAPQRAEVGGAPGAWGWMPHVTTRAATARARAGGAPGTTEVLCPQRLDADKRFVVRAAAEVARAAGARLTVVGRGGDGDWIREHLAARGDLRFRVVQDPDIAPWIARAEVVVAVGLVALEAAAAGACVVGACYADGGRPWEPATPATWTLLHRQNFAGIAARPLSGEAVWRRLAAITAADRAALAHLVRRDAAPGAALDALLRAARPARTTATSPLIRATVAAAMAVQADQADLVAGIPRAMAARDRQYERAERAEALLARADGRAGGRTEARAPSAAGAGDADVTGRPVVAPGPVSASSEAEALAAMLTASRARHDELSEWLRQLAEAHDHHRARAERAERLLARPPGPPGPGPAAD